MKILLGDDDAERASASVRRLAADRALTVQRLRSDEALADTVVSQQPDMVLIDVARPDRDALGGIGQVTAQHPRPVVMFPDGDGDPALNWKG